MFEISISNKLNPLTGYQSRRTVSMDGGLNGRKVRIKSSIVMPSPRIKYVDDKKFNYYYRLSYKSILSEWRLLGGRIDLSKSKIKVSSGSVLLQVINDLSSGDLLGVIGIVGAYNIDKYKDYRESSILIFKDLCHAADITYSAVKSIIQSAHSRGVSGESLISDEDFMSALKLIGPPNEFRRVRGTRLLMPRVAGSGSHKMALENTAKDDAHGEKGVKLMISRR